MNEKTKELVEKVERRASVRPEHTGPSRSDYRTLTEACEDMLALCGALRETDAERGREIDLHRQQREAWIEYTIATRDGCNQGSCPGFGDCDIAEHRIDRAKDTLIALGVPSEVFG